MLPAGATDSNGGVTLDSVLSVLRITAAGVAASGALRQDIGAQIALGAVLALIETAAALARGEQPEALPSYDEGLRRYLEAAGKIGR